MEKKINALRQFLDGAHSTYHAVVSLREMLEEAGYLPLKETNTWNLVPGGKYYLTRGGSAIIAFRIPKENPGSFLISASHSDRPCFKIKENSELKSDYIRLAVERYGGTLISTWLDRPLSVAGRVLVETESGVESRLVDIDRDIALIPNVAIHMNRTANEGIHWNTAVDTLPLLGTAEAAGKFWAQIEELAGGKILGHDLSLYVRQKSCVWGLDEEFISSPALDDLECAWGCTRGFLDAKPTTNIPVLCVFDSEEVGSSSYQGAAADFLKSTLSRICRALDLEEGRQLAGSFLVSADNGHTRHPNHPELSDSTNAPAINGGVVIKFNASQRYTTSGLSCAVFRKICQDAGVPVQTYCNRADLAGGSTLGNVSLSQVAVNSVDIGLAQLAMHSCYETAGVKDVVYLADAMTAFYGTELAVPEDGMYQIR